MSMDTFKRLCHENGLNEEDMIEEQNIEIHDIPKGIYKCTTYYELIEDYGQHLYHTLELINGEQND